MRNRPCLTHDDLDRMMTACIAEASKNKWPVAIAIVDNSGFLLKFDRLDGSGQPSSEVAIEKARMAGMTGRPSKFWEDRLKERPAFLRFPVGVPIQGGVPVLYQGELIGGIGVSGVQSHEDEAVAAAGAAALV
jgi:glc operon protein GlcG